MNDTTLKKIISDNIGGCNEKVFLGIADDLIDISSDDSDLKDDYIDELVTLIRDAEKLKAALQANDLNFPQLV